MSESVEFAMESYDGDITSNIKPRNSDQEYSRFYVITGASGAGKSTLISALNKLGYSTIPEAALAIMREQLECNGTLLPSLDRKGFMEAVLTRSIQDYERAHSFKTPVFFDRGIPEWLRFSGGDDEHRQLVTRRHRYNHTIFVAEPWADIYVRDHERTHSFDRAEKSYAPTIAAYLQAGYETRAIPKVSVPERLAFILAQTGV